MGLFNFKSLIRYCVVCLFMATSASPLFAQVTQSGISIEGDFTADAQTQTFDFTLPADVTNADNPYFLTWSHSGGTNLAGRLIGGGGFDPTVALRILGGAVVGQADDGKGAPGNYDSLLDFSTGDEPLRTFPSIPLPNPLLADTYQLDLKQLNDTLNTQSGRSGQWAIDLVAPGINLDLHDFATIGPNSGTPGITHVTVQGSDATLFNTGEIAVGKYTFGLLNILSGGRVSNTHGLIGRYSDGNGFVNVDGDGSDWTNNGGLIIGSSGDGNLTISDGGTVSSHNSAIAQSATTRGDVIVLGNGSTWTNTGDLYLGGNDSGSGGSGTLSIDSGGTVNIGGTLKLWSTGTIDLVAGLLQTKSMDIAAASTLNHTGGTLRIQDGTLTDNNTGDFLVDGVNNPILTFNNATFDLDTRYLIVGQSNQGTLHIQNGATVRNLSAIIGAYENSNGILTVNGDDSNWRTDFNITVGFSGDATLNIQDGATVNNQKATIGQDASSTSTVNVTGEGSQWINSLPLLVGNNGDATLNIEAGATVSNTNGFIAIVSDSTSAVTATGPLSNWTNDGDLTIGTAGDATLNIQAEATVTNTNGFIAIETDSTSTVTVTGPLSNWTNDGELTIGTAGDATLNIEAGAAVSNTNGFIAIETDSTSAVTVDGADSSWTNTGELTIGTTGDGTLNIQNEANVSNTNGYIANGFNSVSAVTVNESTWTNTGNLEIGSLGHGTLNIQNGATVTNINGHISKSSASTSAVTVTGAGSTWSNTGELFVGQSGDGTLNILDSATVTAQGQTYVGLRATSAGHLSFDNTTLTTGGLLTGIADLAGTGAINTTGLVSDIDLTFNASNGLQQQLILNNLPNQNIAINLNQTSASDLGVGYRGSATLTIAEARIVESKVGRIGYHQGAVGVANITGAGSEWNNTGDLYLGGSELLGLGSGGAGTLNIEAEASVSNETSYIGNNVDSTGLVNVNGENSTWINRGSLNVGYVGNGTLNIQAGAAVSNLSATIGVLPDSIGAVTVTGDDSNWDNEQDLTIARYGAATLNIEEGASVTDNNATIGFYANSTGVVTVTGEGSTWTHNNLSIGGSTTVSGGSGTLNINDGATVTVADTLKLWGTGFINLTDGTLQTKNLDDLHSNVVHTGGTLIIQDGYLVGNNKVDGADNPNLILHNASTTFSNQDLFVGDTSLGTLTIQAGTTLNNLFGVIGNEANSNGTVNVTGTGSSWTISNQLYIGSEGQGALDILEGAIVNSTANATAGYIGLSAGSNGTVTVNGLGSTWNATGITVGLYGEGALNIQDDAIVNNTFANIGSNTNSIGAVNVTGANSKWINTSSLNIAAGGDEPGHGTLTIQDGAIVTNTSGTIGVGAQSQGFVTVTGSSSTWTNSSSLVVGYSGPGTLLIQQGSTVTSNGGNIGSIPGGVGTVTITGQGSLWDNTANLNVGFNGGNGTLNIQDNATVNVATNLYIGDIGTLNLSSGSLNTTTLGITANAAFSHTGGTLTVTDGSVINEKTSEFIIDGANNPNLVLNNASFNLTTRGIIVGRSQLGQLNLQNGATLNTAYGSLGQNENSVASATLTGTDTTWTNTGNLLVGGNGSGTLNIQDGATLTNEHALIGSPGTLTPNLTATATATITGPQSNWTSSLFLIAGHTGSGTLNIQNGATATSNGGGIGNEATATGFATVTGQDSNWNITTDLFVGFNGEGTLDIQNGANVTNATGFIANFADSMGIATVSDPGSTWDTSGSLYVGGSDIAAGGSGTLNIQNNATVIVADTLTNWNGGVITLESGSSLQATALNNTDGGAFNFSGGTLQTRLFNGDLLNQAGTLAPISSLDTININGHYTQEENANLQIELQFDELTAMVNFDPLYTPSPLNIPSASTLNVSGALTLAGTLDLKFPAEFSPVPFSSFTIATFDTLAGDFDTTLNQQLANDLLLIPEISINTYALTVAIPGDFNLDGKVNIADLIVWAQNFGRPDSTFQTGDATFDSLTNIADLIEWAQSFGKTTNNFINAPLTALTSATAIPEPSTFLIFGTVALCTLRRRKNDHSL